jgi:hypothetical protein
VKSLSIQEVTRSLEQLNEIHEQLLALGEQKKQVLIDNQVNELTLITNKESKLMKQIAEYEQQWLANASAFLEEKGYQSSSAMTMTELIKLVYKADEKQALLDVQGKLMNTIRQIKEQNALNQQMIEQSLSYIDYTLDLMTGDPDQDMTYQKPNSMRDSKRRGIFDTKA